MTYFHPAWLAHLQKQHVRDAWRFAPPGTPEAKPPGWLDPSMTRVRLKEAQEEEARRRAMAEQEAFEREVLALRHDFAKLRLEYELQRFRLKYGVKPNQQPERKWDGQPRDDGRYSFGKMPRRVQSDELGSTRKVPPIVKEFGKWTARQFVSRYCEARINRELPGQFEDMTISDIWDIAKGGDARARTCLKPLNSGKFRK
jgi:hypothetical protein